MVLSTGGTPVETVTLSLLFRLLLLTSLAGASSARAETPEQWVELLTRVHGGFGSFLPVGIRIGEGALHRLNAQPREISGGFFQGESGPRPFPARDGVLGARARPRPGTPPIAAEKTPPRPLA